MSVTPRIVMISIILGERIVAQDSSSLEADKNFWSASSALNFETVKLPNTEVVEFRDRDKVENRVRR